ncbi:MAG: DUF4236 domain-containing protein [Actinobacteria bacterium]|nr:DUF4236 domain-containing protein [Actinomycetota bacterium]
MGFRFSRRISLFKGLRLNISKSGTSVSVGSRGGWLTFGKKGTRATVGIPGTGMSWSEKIEDPAPKGEQPSVILRLVGLVGLLSAILLAGIYIYAFFATVSR